MSQCIVLLKDKIVISDAIIHLLTFVGTVRYPSNTVRCLSLLWFIKTTPIFDAETDTVTDLVNIKREGNILQDAMLPFCVLSGAHS